MSSLTGAQKRYLRSLANRKKPAVSIGKHGLTESLYDAIDQALDDHELIKVKFQDFKTEKDAFIKEVEEQCECACVGKIGHTALFYRPNPDLEQQQIKLPKSDS
jgi:RNA-binding protein